MNQGIDLITQLETLARGLCHDAGVRVVRSAGGWYCNTVTGEIGVDLESAVEIGATAAAGIVAHEAAHRLITPAVAQSLGLPGALDHTFRNMIEDGRIERWMGRRYIGTQLWFAEARRKMHCTVPLDDRPWYSQALRLMHAQAVQFAEIDLHGLAPGVGAAVAEVREVLERACETAPDPDSVGSLGWAAQVRRCWVESGELLRASVVPVIVRLMRGDAERLAWSWQIGETPFDELPRFWGRLGVAPGAMCEADVARAMLALERSWHADEALRALASLRIAVRHGVDRAVAGATIGDADEVAAVRPRTLDRLANDELASHGRRLATALSDRLPPARRHGSARRETGRRVAMGAALNRDADPNASSRIWLDRSLRTRTHLAASLLVDLSGSMAGAKVAAAVDGIEVLMRAFDSLQIPFEVNGFQDELFEIHAFGARCTARALRDLDGYVAETKGTRLRGHNRPRYNDDGPCVTAAARRLHARPERHRLLVVVSDGSPEGRHSGDDDLTRAVAAVRRSNITLIGVGIGSCGGAVAEFYPDHAIVADIAELPRSLARVFSEAIR